MLSLPPAATEILVLSSQQCFLAEPFLSFHMKAGLSLQFLAVVQSGDPGDDVMKAQIYSVQLCLLGV